jgi:8-oxo-dGTP pyrophosphatase MutT (NUDIX family)
VRIQLGWFDEKTAARIAGIEAGQIIPAVPRDAATVVVLRTAAPRAGDAAEAGARAGAAGAGGAGVEVLMLRRSAAMKFAPGAYVFPGGAVDAADYGAEVGWQGPSPAEFGARLGAPPDVARALVCAAVRETFEESGVLLAGEPGGGPLAAPSGAGWEADRAAMTSGALTLAGLLAKRDLVLRADLLVPWARWIAPEGEPRRFDARFFAAALPDGQQAVGHEAESDRVEWLRPASAIEAAKAGEISLFPPTAATLNDFASAVDAGDGLADILAVRRTIAAIRPRFVLDDGEAWLELPDEAGYPR